MWRRFLVFILQLFGHDPRGIFRYWDGRCWRFADPIVIARKLMSHPVFEWDEHPAQVRDPDPKISSEAIRICAETVREVFGIREFSDGGLVEAELCSVLWQFQDYLASVKKNGNGQQTSPPPMESPPLFPGDGFVTKPDSESGSIPNESDTGTPGT